MAYADLNLTRKQRLLTCGLGVALLMQYEYSKIHLNRRWWTHPWATEGRHVLQGFRSNLVQELRSTNDEGFYNFFGYVNVYIIIAWQFRYFVFWQQNKNVLIYK